MKKIKFLVIVLLVALVPWLFSPSATSAASTATDKEQVFVDIPTYGIYQEPVDFPVPQPDVIRISNGVYAKKVNFDEYKGKKVKLVLTLYAQNDIYDRIATVYYNDKPTVENAKTIFTFTTPFFLKDSNPNTRVYEWDVSDFSNALTDKDGTYIIVNIGGNTWGGEVAFRFDLDFQFDESDQPADPFQANVINAEIYENTISGTVHVDRDIEDAVINVTTFAGGADAGGEEYQHRPHNVYLDGQLVGSFLPKVDCTPYRYYSPRGNPGIFTSAATRNWCPGAGVPVHQVYIGDLDAGDHTVQIEIENTTFVGWSYFLITANIAQAKSDNINLALNKPVTASSVEPGTAFSGANIVDGKSATRWSSDYNDNQSISVDLGAVYNINRVKLHWEVSYGKAYTIQVSTDGETWTEAFSETGGNGEIDNISFPAVDARYVKVNGTERATNNGYSLWELEVYRSIESTPQAISRDDWTIQYVSSEETVGENTPAANVFDGYVSTFWHSKWSEGNDPHPHDIQIDLGAVYQLNGFQYLPRQDNNTNGRIKDYEFYVSLDGIHWGEPVKAGALADAFQFQEVNFEPTSGRYIRLRSLNEISGRSFTAISELNVLGRGLNVQDLEGLISQGYANSWISNQGIYLSLLAKVNNIQKHIDSPTNVVNGLKALEQEITAQSEKYIDATFADLLLAEIAKLNSTESY